MKTANSWIEAYTNAKTRIDVCLEFYAIKSYRTITVTIPVNSIDVNKVFMSGYYFNATSNGLAEIIIKSDTEISAMIYINSTITSTTKTTFLYC